MNEKPRVYLDQWAMQIGGSITPYAAPETYRYVLMGTVRDHPEIEDGEFVTTSHIEDLDLEAGTCETKNTLYILETPREDYIEHCRKVGSESVQRLEALVS